MKGIISRSPARVVCDKDINGAETSHKMEPRECLSSLLWWTEVFLFRKQAGFLLLMGVMRMLTSAPKGTKDILPDEIYKWYYVEEKFREMAERFGFREIRIPVFEHTELFQRGVGDTTDIVQKEMYTFNDKAGRSLTLRLREQQVLLEVISRTVCHHGRNL